MKLMKMTLDYCSKALNSMVSYMVRSECQSIV